MFNNRNLEKRKAAWSTLWCLAHNRKINYPDAPLRELAVNLNDIVNSRSESQRRRLPLHVSSTLTSALVKMYRIQLDEFSNDIQTILYENKDQIGRWDDDYMSDSSSDVDSSIDDEEAMDVELDSESSVNYEEGERNSDVNDQPEEHEGNEANNHHGPAERSTEKTSSILPDGAPRTDGDKNVLDKEVQVSFDDTEDFESSSSVGEFDPTALIMIYENKGDRVPTKFIYSKINTDAYSEFNT